MAPTTLHFNTISTTSPRTTAPPASHLSAVHHGVHASLHRRRERRSLL